jgi:CRP/FNR family transcriptional regulator, cyclic AMP receptor protein
VITREAPVARTNWINRLFANPLFEGVRRKRVAQLLPHAIVRRITKGSVLHAPGDSSGPMYLLLRGGLRSYQLTADGRKLLLEIVEPDGWDGLLPMLGQRGHFTEATADSIVACLDWRLLEQLFEADSLVVRNLVEMVAQRLEGREEHLESMVIRDPTRRLARQLLALARAVGEPVDRDRAALPRTITHQLLADMLGVRRETVTLHLADLVQRGAVRGKRPLVIDRNQLELIASNGDG